MGAQTPGALPGSTTSLTPRPILRSPNAAACTARVDAGAAVQRAAVVRQLFPLTSIGARGCPTPPHWTRWHNAGQQPCPPQRKKDDDAYYDLAQPTVTTSRSAASTIILNRLDDLEFSLTGCDYDHTERDRRRAVAKLTDAAARNPCHPSGGRRKGCCHRRTCDICSKVFYLKL